MRSRTRIAALAAAGLGAAALLAPVGGAWVIAVFAVHWPGYQHRTPAEGLPPRDAPASGDPRSAHGYAFEEVEFPAADGSTLRGWFVPGAPEARAGVVTVHGAGDDRRWFVRHLPIFHEAGYPVLLLDCREHGVSDGVGRGISFGIREHRDVSSAVAYLRRERGLARVAVIGTSQGGASVILAAASDPEIDAVIAENPFTSVVDLLRDTHGEDGAPPRPLAGLIAFFVAWRADGLGLLSPLGSRPAHRPAAPLPAARHSRPQDPVLPLGTPARGGAPAGRALACARRRPRAAIRPLPRRVPGARGRFPGPLARGRPRRRSGRRLPQASVPAIRLLVQPKGEKSGPHALSPPRG